MGIFKNAVFGNIKNSIGDVVAYRSRDQNCLRGKPTNYNDANTFKQRQNRAAQIIRTKLLSLLLTDISQFISVKLPNCSIYSSIMSGFKNSAFNFAATVETDSIAEMLQKISISGEGLVFGDGLFQKPIIADKSSYNSSTFAVTVQVVNISSYSKVPVDAVYTCFYIEGDHSDVHFSTSLIAVDNTSLVFNFPYATSSHTNFGWIMLTSSGKSSFVVPTGKITYP